MLTEYLSNKWGDIFYFWIVRILVSIFLFLSGASKAMLILTLIVYILCDVFYLSGKYFKYKRESEKLRDILNKLDRLYYAHELIKRPKDEEIAIYYDLLKASNRDMVNEINKKEKEFKEFKEIIEEWIHEMKTPITSIKILKDSYSEKDLEYETSRLEEILELCLTLIRMESLEKDYHVNNINLMDLIHSIIFEERQFMRQKNLKLNIDISKDSNIKSDEKWVRFIIKQIILNSVKYTKDKGEIKIREKVTENNYILYIEDNGGGILESELPRIFERGFTGSNIKKNTASGLGLYLAKVCADKMNIKIKIESKFGKFTLATLYFPKNNEPFNTVR